MSDELCQSTKSLHSSPLRGGSRSGEGEARCLTDRRTSRASTAARFVTAHFYWLLMSATGIEMRFGDRIPNAVRGAVYADNGALIEEARIPTINCSSRRCGSRHRPAPPGRGWKLADDTHASVSIWRRQPP